MKKRFMVLWFVACLCAMGYSETLKKVYDESLNPMEQVDKALLQARKENKFVMCQVGGNWCPWCLRFADFVAKDSTLRRVVEENFVYIHVNYNPRRKGEDSADRAAQAQAMMKRLGQPGRFGYPVFVVLDEKGSVLHIQDSSFLEEGEGYDRDKVLRFFKGWTPKALEQ